MSKKVCVILSGCGFLDGAEIHEAVLTLLAIERNGGEWHCCAPDVDFTAVDHITQEETGQRRNAMVEAARIARGRIASIADVKAADFDALAMPGGFGAVNLLSDFAKKGPAANVHPEVERLITEFLEQGKPTAVFCIAPATFARVASSAGKHVKLTVGNTANHASVIHNITAMGDIEHVDATSRDAVIDAGAKVGSAPAYMFDAPVADVAEGIDKVIQQVLAWA